MVIEDYKGEIKGKIESVKGIENKLLNFIEFIYKIFNHSSELTVIYLWQIPWIKQKEAKLRMLSVKLIDSFLNGAKITSRGGRKP